MGLQCSNGGKLIKETKYYSNVIPFEYCASNTATTGSLLNLLQLNESLATKGLRHLAVEYQMNVELFT